MNDNRTFIHCEKCGKRLIARLTNGLFHFMFGKNVPGSEGSPVELFIHGSVKIRCLRRSCRHMNTLTYFPNTVVTGSNQLQAEDSNKQSKKSRERG